MKTSFRQWVAVREANNDMTTSFVGGNPNSSQMSFALDENPPVSNSSLPPQMNTFRSWYNFNRGKWSEVEQAAQQNPAIKQFLKQAATKLINQSQPMPTKNPYGSDTDEFDIEQPTVTGTIGDELEKLVKQTIPSHGHQKDWQVPQQYMPNQKKQVPSIYQNGNQQVPQTPMGADSTQLITHLWHRQDRLEKKVNDLATGIKSVA